MLSALSSSAGGGGGGGVEVAAGHLPSRRPQVEKEVAVESAEVAMQAVAAWAEARAAHHRECHRAERQ